MDLTTISNFSEKSLPIAGEIPMFSFKDLIHLSHTEKVYSVNLVGYEHKVTQL